MQAVVGQVLNCPSSLVRLITSDGSDVVEADQAKGRLTAVVRWIDFDLESEVTKDEWDTAIWESWRAAEGPNPLVQQGILERPKNLRSEWLQLFGWWVNRSALQEIGVYQRE